MDEELPAAASRYSSRIRGQALSRLLGNLPFDNTVVNLPSRREIHGTSARNSLTDCGYRLLHSRFQEQNLNSVSLDRVNASIWLDDRRVLMGTKCGKIIKKDVYTDENTLMPNLIGTNPLAQNLDGIHAFDINSSGTLLATNSKGTSDLAIYQLPSFNPVVVGEMAHCDQIFDIKWITDEHCVTGSGEGLIALWHVTINEPLEIHINYFETQGGARPDIGYPVMVAQERKFVCFPDQIKALKFNKIGQDMSILSAKGKLYTWDIPTFTQKRSRQLRHTMRPSCMAYEPSRQLHVIGTKSHIEIIDRDLAPVISIGTPHIDSYVESISINRGLITIGTRLGTVLFFDITAGKYLQHMDGRTCTLTTGAGYLSEYDSRGFYFGGRHVTNAVNTHCYDDSESRLFTAGGPVGPDYVGSYAALWQ